MNYDEDINENNFFKQLKENFGHLISKATEQKWIICVPRNFFQQNHELTEDNFKDHILEQREQKNGNSRNYQTLNGTEVQVKNGSLLIKKDEDQKRIISIPILFEETFYTEDLKSYKIWCVSNFMNLNLSISFAPNLTQEILTLQDSHNFLQNEFSVNHEILGKIDTLVNNFLLETPKLYSFTLKELKNRVGTLFDHCFKMAAGVILNSNETKINHRHLNIAIEIYVQNAIFKPLFQAILTNLAVEDSNFNKSVRNLSEVQIRDLEIKPEVAETILTAKQNLAKINNFTTFLDKINCLRWTFSEINSTKVTSDELLSVFTFLILKSNIPNWISNLYFLKEYQFWDNNLGDEPNFLLSTLEASIVYIKSGVKLKKVAAGSELFEYILTGNNIKLRALLEQKRSKENSVDKTPKLCHPLCSCDSCESVLTSQKVTSNIFTTNESGMASLHYVAQNGSLKTADLLLKYGVNNLINKKDFSGATPLHYAALRGAQDMFLLFLDHGAQNNSLDNEKNSPLHFACLNGHLGIVKAILFNKKDIDVNSVNVGGDSGLHFACRWGYGEIVQILIEHGASPNLKNRLGKTPSDYALNIKIREILDLKEANGDDVSLEYDVVDDVIKTMSPHELKKAELLLKAVTYDDVPLICFYLGLALPEKSVKQCHPLCTCENCETEQEENSKNPDKLDINLSNSEGCTALHMASLHGQFDIVKLLVSYSANVNLTTIKGQTPLHFACQTERVEIVKFLVDFIDDGPKIDTQDFKGNTPLHLACIARNLDIVKILVGKGAGLGIINKNGKTPVDESEGLVLEFLKSYCSDKNLE